VASYPATARTSRLLCTSLERMTQIRSCIERASRLDSQEERRAALEIDSLLARAGAALAQAKAETNAGDHYAI
jgi:hypothetical protein